MRKSENNPTRPKETFFGFWLKSTAVKIVFIAILIVCAIIVVRHYMKKTVDTSTPLQIVTNQSIDITPTQIRSIEQIGKWSFLEISDEEIVDTIRRGFFSDDELVRIYYGTLRLGIDTRQAHEGWIAMRGDTLCATLPPVKLLDNDFIDDAILVGMSRVRILHGKGNGILRQLIRQYLQSVPNVTSCKDEHVQFGGAGITVVDF